MRQFSARRRGGLVGRVALASAASLALVASGGTGALAEEISPDDSDLSGQTSGQADDGTSQGESETSDEGVTGEEQAGGGQSDPSAGATEPDAGDGVDGSETGGETTTGSEGGEDAVDDVEEQEQSPDSELPAGPDAALEDIIPNFGTGKVYIGVQQADGTWIPEMASFQGVTMNITITDADPTTSDRTTSCTVTTPTLVRDLNGASAACVTADSGSGALVLDPGEVATIAPVASSASGGVVLDTTPLVAQACDEGDLGCVIGGSGVTALATGPLPVANADQASVVAGQTIDIDVLANDDDLECAPVTEVAVTEPASQGAAAFVGQLVPPAIPASCDAPAPAPITGPDAPVSAAAIGASTTPVLRYTAPAGFTGTDTVTYALTSRNGVTTGTVSVTVTGPVVTPPVIAPPTSPVGSGLGTGTGVRITAGRLPSTGGPAVGLLGVGGALVVAGAGAMAVRRRTARGDLVG